MTKTYPLTLHVNYKLHLEFRALVEQQPGCRVTKVVELKCCELLHYWIDCPPEKEDDITHMAFMTWIRNPLFQECYSDTKAFQPIAEQYKQAQLN